MSHGSAYVGDRKMLALTNARDENFSEAARLCALNSINRTELFWPSLGRYLQCSICFVALALTLACSCENKDRVAPSEPTQVRPLVDGGVPSDVTVEIHPALGTTIKRPVALVLAGDGVTCETVHKTWAARAHVLCLAQGFQGSDSDAEKTMKDALSYVKSKYERYLSGSPALMIAEERYAKLGFQLMLREPRVFGHAYLPGFDPASLSSTTVYALFSGGAETLILGEELNPNQAPLRSMSSRAGLAIHAVGEGPEALGRALDLLRSADPRLQLPPSPNTAAPSK